MNGLMLSTSGWVVYSRDGGKKQTVWDDNIGSYWSSNQGRKWKNIPRVVDPIYLPEEYLL